MPPQVVDSIDALRRLSGEWRDASIGFVPTMGALHAGHARLIEHARRDCDRVVVSIFVNPLQFNNRDDLERYPRTLDADIAVCRELDVDVVFAPAAAEMYAQTPLVAVEVRRLTDHLCGPYRPGHFTGVATVVLALLNIVQPDRAYFGEKDRQQLAVVQRTVDELHVPVTIVPVATLREPDGLAMSSRNVHLTPGERALAPLLYQALRAAEDQIARGGLDPEVIVARAAARIPQSPLLRLEYLSIVDPREMQPMDRIAGPVVVAGALWVGGTRLIDNLLCEPALHS